MNPQAKLIHGERYQNRGCLGKGDDDWEGAQGQCFWRNENILIGLQTIGVKIHTTGRLRPVGFIEYKSHFN